MKFCHSSKLFMAKKCYSSSAAAGGLLFVRSPPAISRLCYVPHCGQCGQLLLLQWDARQHTSMNHHQVVPAACHVESEKECCAADIPGLCSMMRNAFADLPRTNSCGRSAAAAAVVAAMVATASKVQ
jgi:hypothetical protein